jgi:uncharacterized protein YebE (UPF0316 family)
MLDWIVNFFTAVPLWEILLIFVAKSIEVSIATLRIILVNKGFRKEGVIISFFEIILWIIIVSSVLNGITEAPIKALAYSAGFSLGIYFGSKIENKLAFGKVLIHAISSKKTAEKLACLIRESGYGVTSLDAHGKDVDRTVLMIFANRKGKEEIIKLIEKESPDAMIVSNDVFVIRGGFITPFRRLAK